MNQTVPCEECISFAICLHQNKIECETLYRFLCEMDDNTYLRFKGYKKGAANLITSVYNKYIVNTNIVNYTVVMSKNQIAVDIRRDAIYRGVSFELFE